MTNQFTESVKIIITITRITTTTVNDHFWKKLKIKNKNGK